MTVSDPGPRCPHCASYNIDRGATGLDQCNQCGGLSRDGQPLAATDRDILENELIATGAVFAVLSGMAPVAGRIQIVDGPEGIRVANFMHVRIPGILKSRYRITITMDPGGDS